MDDEIEDVKIRVKLKKRLEEATYSLEASGEKLPSDDPEIKEDYEEIYKRCIEDTWPEVGWWDLTDYEDVIKDSIEANLTAEQVIEKAVGKIDISDAELDKAMKEDLVYEAAEDMITDDIDTDNKDDKVDTATTIKNVEKPKKSDEEDSSSKLGERWSKWSVDEKPSPGRVKEVLESMFKDLVPEKGKAKTVAGELIRSMMRLMYKNWSDGEVFYEGTGLMDCAPAAAFILKTIKNIQAKEQSAEDGEIKKLFDLIRDKQFTDGKYLETLNTIAEKLIDYIVEEHPDLITAENDDDMLTTDIADLVENQPKYELEVDIPLELSAYIKDGSVDTSVLENDVADLIHGDEEADGEEEIKVEDGAEKIKISNMNIDVFDRMKDQLKDYLDNYFDKDEEEDKEESGE